MNILTLYRKGLLFLKDLVEDYGTDPKMFKLILNTFFNGKYTEFRFKTLNYIQKDPSTDACLREIINILDKIYNKLSRPIAIRVEVEHTNNVILPLHINTALFSDYEDAVICFKELVIPLVYNHTDYNYHTKNYLTEIKKFLGKPKVTRESVLEDICSLIEPEFYQPTEDTYYGFIHIDKEKLANSVKDQIGIFTNTKDFRIVNIGNKIYADFVQDGVLYKQTINLKSSSWYLEILNLIKHSRALVNPTALLDSYQDTKRRVYICQEN